jgi:hypothetical protein
MLLFLWEFEPKRDFYSAESQRHALPGDSRVTGHESRNSLALDLVHSFAEFLVARPAKRKSIVQS